MDPFGIVGLGMQGIGLLGQLFGKSEESRRAEQEARNRAAIQKTLEFLDARKRKTLDEGITRLGQMGRGSVASARSAAMQRAAAAGRSGEAEAYVVPAQAPVAQAANEGMSNFVSDTNRTYDTAAINAQMGGLNQSLEPLPEQLNAADYALPVGAALTKYSMLRQQNQQTPQTPEAGGDIAPNTPFKIDAGEGSSGGVQFDFNKSGTEEIRRRALKRGSIF